MACSGANSRHLRHCIAFFFSLSFLSPFLFRFHIHSCARSDTYRFPLVCTWAGPVGSVIGEVGLYTVRRRILGASEADEARHAIHTGRVIVESRLSLLCDSVAGPPEAVRRAKEALSSTATS